LRALALINTSCYFYAEAIGAPCGETDRHRAVALLCQLSTAVAESRDMSSITARL